MTSTTVVWRVSINARILNSSTIDSNILSSQSKWNNYYRSNSDTHLPHFAHCLFKTLACFQIFTQSPVSSVTFTLFINWSSDLDIVVSLNTRMLTSSLFFFLMLFFTWPISNRLHGSQCMTVLTLSCFVSLFLFSRLGVFSYDLKFSHSSPSRF